MLLICAGYQLGKISPKGEKSKYFKIISAYFDINKINLDFAAKFLNFSFNFEQYLD